MGKLYGILQLPGAETPYPLIILSHGFGGSHAGNQDYADYFTSQGFATFNFDFCGGGFGSKSDGTMLEMSVLTEAADLNAVIDYFRPRFPVIFLWGASQTLRQWCWNSRPLCCRMMRRDGPTRMDRSRIQSLSWESP